MDEFGSLVGAVIGVVGFIVEQQIVYIGVVVLDAVECFARSLALADDKPCAALGGGTQGSLGIIGRITRGGIGIGGVAVRVGEGLHALPQHGVCPILRAGGACHQCNGLSACRDQRRVIGLVDERCVVGGGGHGILFLRRVGGVSRLAGSQPRQ